MNFSQGWSVHVRVCACRGGWGSRRRLSTASFIDRHFSKERAGGRWGFEIVFCVSTGFFLVFDLPSHPTILFLITSLYISLSPSLTLDHYAKSPFSPDYSADCRWEPPVLFFQIPLAPNLHIFNLRRNVLSRFYLLLYRRLSPSSYMPPSLV
ncbi:hypothetical protein BDD12DRAFT_9662 [Trichophaea hybrida]|nr:hypothetical protein BDD12DRAFT_9662 [Trichophaea hybrida]